MDTDPISNTPARGQPQTQPQFGDAIEAIDRRLALVGDFGGGYSGGYSAPEAPPESLQPFRVGAFARAGVPPLLNTYAGDPGARGMSISMVSPGLEWVYGQSAPYITVLQGTKFGASAKTTGILSAQATEKLGRINTKVGAYLSQRQDNTVRNHAIVPMALWKHCGENSANLLVGIAYERELTYKYSKGSENGDNSKQFRVGVYYNPFLDNNTIRVELSALKTFMDDELAARGGVMLEWDLSPSQLVYTPPPSPPAPPPTPPSSPYDLQIEEANRSKAGSGRICYRVPGTDQLLDITALAEPLLDDDFKAKIPVLTNTGADAQFFDADGTPQVWSLDMDDIRDKLSAALAPYVPEDLGKQAEAALAYAPMAMTTVQHAPTAVRTAQTINALRTVEGLNTVRTAVSRTGIGLLFGEMIGDYIEDAYTSPEAIERMAMGGTLPPERKLYHRLVDDMTMDQIGLADMINTSPVSHKFQIEQQIENGELSYPVALDVLQQLQGYQGSDRADENDTVQRVSGQIIQLQPGLRYLDSLERYALGRIGGADITDLRGGTAAELAEATWQLTSEADRPALSQDINNTFGLERMDDGTWWVTASAVDQGDGKPMADQGKLWDNIAAIWRSEFKQKQIDQERAVEVISTFAQDLGLHITPEVAAKIAEKARA